MSELPWTYEWSARKRPFIHPLRTPRGHVLTRNAPEDHPWHHGLWFTIKFVNGENFWEEYDEYGVVRHTGDPLEDGGYEGDLVWIRPDRETVIINEHRLLTHVPLGTDAYAIDLQTTLTPTADVELDRTPFTTWGGYGGLAFRGRGDFHDTRILLSDGREVERVLGEPGEWLDISGLVGGDDGDEPAGLAILDRPANPSHPVPWYGSTKAATYGDEGWSNFVNAAFLWDGPISVAAGSTIAFDYRVIVHDGVWDRARVQAEHEAWVASG